MWDFEETTFVTVNFLEICIFSSVRASLNFIYVCIYFILQQLLHEIAYNKVYWSILCNTIMVIKCYLNCILICSKCICFSKYLYSYLHSYVEIYNIENSLSVVFPWLLFQLQTDELSSLGK